MKYYTTKYNLRRWDRRNFNNWSSQYMWGGPLMTIEQYRQSHQPDFAPAIVTALFL